MGVFDRMEQGEDYQTVKRIGDANQSEKLPMKDKPDAFKVRKELDTVTPDQLLNQCKREREGRKHQLLVFYRNGRGKGEWIPVAMPRLRALKYRGRGYFEVVDCRNGRRKTFLRSRVKTVRKDIDRATGKWRVYPGIVDTARF